MDTVAEPLQFCCRFEKKGPIRFISHLDLTRAFHRAFSRANLPLKFSEGFSPHPKFAFALPLSVGTESCAELAHFTLKTGFEISPEELKETLQAQMPAGINILEITDQKGKFSQIAFASYTVTLPHLKAEDAESIPETLRGEVLVSKKNKKGKTVEKDISSGIKEVKTETKDGALTLHLLLSASGENYLKPELVLDALRPTLPEGALSEKRILRTGVYREDLTEF
jgi:radical SAM-linked protein